MKKILPLLLFLSIFTFLSCHFSGQSETNKKEVLGDLVEISISVDGMTCSGCENTVNTQLLKFDGVVESTASHIEKNVIVKVDTLLTSVNEMKAEIGRVGYTIIE
ncbi:MULTISPECIES: cation transporter [unclassified Lentimicrobium]|uniref:cation transporter n=1 Tax=unclassified Lentimicrobium TaxID=2677434 RepID=UPI0015569218|nr:MULTISPECIES: cation transporter [unclassified Lentimicrobium]NPD46167.1 heavy-metal-associated domain-containing protein [Lentimicrobium sp. S6]NPD83218.1 heavy-metal-associated domain-containing protein [Lentimicrobium sp. L6]